MDRNTYILLEDYMKSCMQDSAHDREHVYRVLYNALEIAGREIPVRCDVPEIARQEEAVECDALESVRQEVAVDYDVLICACLLHDIGRQEQFENPRVCHAQAGAEKALVFLRENHFEEDFARKVAHCIRCHRYRNNHVPNTIEAKILFDADKLDATGAVGIARTLIYKGQENEPLYTLTAEGRVSDGRKEDKPSFFREYCYKLEKLYDRFYTKAGAEMARKRQQAAVSFYENLLAEVQCGYDEGNALLQEQLTEEPLQNGPQ